MLRRNAVKDKSDFSIELRLKKFNREYCWHLLRARARKDEDGNVVSWIGTNTDVHEQKRTGKRSKKSAPKKNTRVPVLAWQLPKRLSTNMMA
jgi:two-component system CheB/CheR fusion protein